MHIQFYEGNEAFQDGNRITEVVRILKKIAQEIEDGYILNDILDVNGNRIGYYMED